MRPEVVRALPDRAEGDARMRELLTRPDPGPVAARIALLHFTGRRTGRAYTVPAGVHTLAGELVVATGSPWRLNFTGGADGALTWRGEHRPARFELLTDPERTARGYLELFRRYEGDAPRRLGIAVHGEGAPGLGEFRTAVECHGLSLVTVVPAAAPPSEALEAFDAANERTPR